MMKLTQSFSYAVQAMIQLAQSPPMVAVPCSRLAATGKMPERFLLHVLRSLVVHRILESSRGVDGGYWLSRSPSEISILEVIEAVEGPMGDMVSNGGIPGDARSKLAMALSEVASVAREQLAEIKISQIASE